MKNADKINVREVSGGAAIAVKVVPGSSRDKVAGVLGDCLKITTSAAAERGKANAAVVRILAAALGLDSRDIELISGPTSPRKEFRVAGKRGKEIKQKLADLI
ncbi:MAG: DUF167 domain-containing protein [Phycisphaerae bacterium]|nr:DUF167 domain-containing protein [Phycisphaerae bacterium]